MSARTTTPGGRGAITINGRKIAAALTQIGSFVTTYLFVLALGIDGPIGFLVALGVEFMLMAAKHNSLLGRGDSIGITAIVVDTLLNAGGLWPYMLRLDKTPTWGMMATSLHLESEVRLLPALGFALLFGFLLSAAPSWLWRHR